MSSIDGMHTQRPQLRGSRKVWLYSKQHIMICMIAGPEGHTIDGAGKIAVAHMAVAIMPI